MASGHDPKPSLGLSLEDFILLNEEIAGMARAGLPLDQGLSALAAEMRGGRLRNVTAEVAADLKTGLTLPEAMERQTGRVPAFYARLLAAGIRAGKVTDVIGTLTVYARALADLRTTVLSALLYPCIVLVLSLVLFSGVTTFLIPQFESIFHDFHIRLPAVTRGVFFVFDHALEFFVIVPASLIVLMILIRLGAGRNAWARFWYTMPIAGELLRSARLAAFSDLLGILVDNGIPLPEAFLLAGQASSDPLMATGAEQVHRGLSQGSPLGLVLREQELVPELVTWMIGVGEKRGTLGPTLHEVAEVYRRKVEMRANLLRSVLPPFLVVIIAGIVVVLFIFALMMPMMSLIEGLGGGAK